MSANYIRIFGPDFEQIGIIDDYAAMIYIRNWQTMGSYELSLTRELASYEADIFADGNIIMVGEDPALTGFIQYQLGDEYNRHDYSIKGYSLLYMLADKLTVPPVGDAYWSYTNTYAEDIMIALVQGNAVSPADPTRKITGLRCAPSQHRGPRIAYQSRYKVLADELTSICKLSGLGVGIRLDLDAGGYVFEVLEGLDRSVGNADDNPHYIFAKYQDNVTKRTYTHSSVGAKTTAYVAGQGEGEDREVIVVGAGYTGLGRKEMFVDARDVGVGETDALTTRGETKLAAAKVVDNFDFSAVGDDYGEGWDLGDIVTWHDEEIGLVANDRVLSVQITHDTKHDALYEPSFGEHLQTIQSAVSSTASEQTNERVGIAEAIAVAKQAAEEAGAQVETVAKLAGSKNKVFYKANPPMEGMSTDDVWFDIDDGYKMHHYDGTSWMADALGSSALADGAVSQAKIAQAVQDMITDADYTIGQWCHANDVTLINGGKIYTGTVDTDQLAANAVKAGKVDADAITGREILAGSVVANHFQGTKISSNNYETGASGMMINLANGAIDSPNFKLTSDGKILATEANITGAINATSGEIAGDMTVSGRLMTHAFFRDINYNNVAYKQDICAMMIGSAYHCYASQRKADAAYDPNNLVEAGYICASIPNEWVGENTALLSAGLAAWFPYYGGFKFTPIGFGGGSPPFEVDRNGCRTKGVTVTSLESVKTNIQQLDDAEAMDILEASEVYKYNLVEPALSDGPTVAAAEVLQAAVLPAEPDRYGLVIGRETDERILNADNDAVDLYSMVSVLWSTVKQLSSRLAQCEEALHVEV